MLRYYFDEHIKSAITSGLRARAVDVLTAQEAGRAGRRITDPDQLAFATAQGRGVVSEDRDFTDPDNTGVPHAGIVLLQRRLTIGQYIEYLELLAKTTEPEAMKHRLLFCDW